MALHAINNKIYTIAIKICALCVTADHVVEVIPWIACSYTGIGQHGFRANRYAAVILLCDMEESTGNARVDPFLLSL